ncbi:MAG: 4'-phosphopantetheinyl transferase superfamily protein, partial [Gammaproteobacteria bacterium]|nr:4'-phosphopantetheinyl transferase superfamily protein [Gammaproteobacteria bacterium]
LWHGVISCTEIFRLTDRNTIDISSQSTGVDAASDGCVVIDTWVVPFESLFDEGYLDTSILNEEEIARRDSFKHVPSRDRYTASRVFLKTVLSKVLDQQPSVFEIQYGPQGKPYISNGPHFNQSHSNNTLLLALTEHCELGVDVEEVDRKINPWDLSKTCFSKMEQSELNTIDNSEAAHQAFIRGWTRKEAVIKALGGGFSIPLKDFSVSLSESNEDALLESAVPHLKVPNWTVSDYLLKDHIAAFAVPRRKIHVRLHKGCQISSLKSFDVGQ